MLDFTDQPYKFFPPRPNRFVIRLAQWANHHFILPGPNHRISDLRIEGEERVRELVERGARLLFLPNHSTHSDPQVMSEVHRRLGATSSFMAAYDVFLRSRFSAWCMQHTGSFSIDREGSDRKAMSAGIEVLKAARSLTIFPEGNVYFTGDRITPFLEGAAFIGIRAQKDLGDDGSAYVIPVAMKFTHLSDQRSAVLDRLEQAANIVGSSLDRTAPALDELRRIGQITLRNHLRDHGFDVPGGDTAIDIALGQAAAVVIETLESDIGQAAKPGLSLTDRLRKIRSKIHKIRTSPDSETDTLSATAWADRAILALRMLGYIGNYVAANPTLDRFADTTEKLLEDLQSKAQKPCGKRRAIVRLCEPIDLREHSGRSAVSGVTTMVEATIQSALDELNATNRSAGSRPF